MVYLSEHRSLATLETLVHAQRATLVLEQYLLIEVEIDDELVLTLDRTLLQPGWNDPVQQDATRRIGDAWLGAHASVALRVPSALIPAEHNILLAPQHFGFAEVRLGPAEGFNFDPRLDS